MDDVEWFRMLGPPAAPTCLADLAEVAKLQRGLVTRRQCLAAGLSSKAIHVRLDSGRWLRVQHGVYLTTPGRHDWWMHAVAAHLACGRDPAWSHHSAAFVWGLVVSPRTIELLVARDFAVRRPWGAMVRRSKELDRRVDQLWRPWVTTVEDTILDIAEAADPDEVFALLGRAFQRQRTSEAVLLTRLDDRSRDPRRQLLRDVVGDVGSGAESTMEVRYLRDVDRAHGLPRGERQTQVDPTSTALHDVGYS